MQEIVRIEFIEGEAVVSHEQLAEGMGMKSLHVRKLLDKHRGDFEQFGVLSFEMTKPLDESSGGRPAKIYYLNEQQATLALTYFRNSETVRAFKIALVKSFYKMKSQLTQGDSGVSQALQVIAESQHQMANGFASMAKSIQVLSDGQAQIVELVNQLQSNTPVRTRVGYIDSASDAKSANALKESLSCINPEHNDNEDERMMFTENIIQILKAYDVGLTQTQLLDKSDYRASVRTRRWLQNGVGVYWNMKIRPGRGYLYYL